MNQHLPHSDQLDIATLSRLFRNTTNSYKYIFFFALLNLIKDRHFEIDDGILMRDIEIEMLVTAWYPHVFFKLSFGTQDKIASALGSIPNIDDDRNSLSRTSPKKLRKRLASCGELLDYQLLRYVPHRILRPFFSAETRSMPDHRVNRKVFNLATKLFYERRPLFRFGSSGKRIFLHPDWIAYMNQHQEILKGWALWHWSDYMQRRNPSIPAVTRKLFPPDRRASLKAKRKFWDNAIEKTSICCIYTEKKLDRGYELDHFLPWRFVAHDQLWNLVPVDSQANITKSDQIPSKVYIDSLAETQHTALSIARASSTDKDWKKEVEPYIADLHITPEETLDCKQLKSAYHRTLKPLISIAEQQGFQSGWIYK